MFAYSVPVRTTDAGYAMVTDRFILVISAEVGTDLALRLWEALVAPDAALEDALTVIAGLGVPHLPDFALVELVDVSTSSVTVAVRGRGQVDLANTERSTFSGSGVGTWIEGSAQRVTSMTIGLASTNNGGERLPLGRALVRADQLHWGEAGQKAVNAASPTVATATPAAPPAPPAPPAPAAPAAEDFVNDETLLSTGARNSQIAEADAATLLGSRRAHQPVAVLKFDDGTVVDLDVDLVFGRSPKPTAFPQARVVRLTSPTKAISGTHATVSALAGVVLVRDLGSTNGTVFTAPGKSPVLLRDGSAEGTVGTVVDFGDGIRAVFESRETTS